MPASPIEHLSTRLRHLAARVPDVFQPGTTLLVAYSGGQDSTALLHALLSRARRHPVRVIAAHVDHGLRANSASQAEEVRGAALAMGAECIVERVDVATYRASQRRVSVQQAARSARYQVLAAVAARLGASAVAVAHTADDQAESVLLHIVRGSGLAGLVGMRSDETYTLRHLGPDASTYTQSFARVPETVRLLRPLLPVERHLTADYCRVAGLPIVEDPSNARRDYTRNRVRLDVVPALEALNPSIRTTLARFAELAGEDLDLLHSLSLDRFDALLAAPPSPQEIAFRRDSFEREPRAIQRRLLREAIHRLAGTTSDTSLGPVEDALDFLVRQSGNRGAYDLPRGVALSVQRDLIVIGRSAQRPPA